MSDLKAYLASKYMSGPKADAILSRSSDPTLKKRKKKVKNLDYVGGSGGGESSKGLMLKDDDEEWRRRKEEEDMDGDEAPVIGKDLATFQKSTSSWSTVAGTSLPLAPTIKSEPDMDDTPPPPPVQLTKRKGGLRTAAQMREEEERLAAEATGRSPSPPPDDDAPDPTVTVHRDASGKIVDVKKLKDEVRLKEEEEKRKEKEREQWSKGLVQRQNNVERARIEKEMGESDVARYAGDASMNREQREQERWNDPAAGFLAKKKTKGPQKPKYKGAAPLNRFAILPGYRWDGVDRSNGFEKKAFQYQNAGLRKEYEANQWSVEDM
ncbi:pre-mRNA-splicing factor CWC26, partial [Tremellales sp. Uapishka_1]